MFLHLSLLISSNTQCLDAEVQRRNLYFLVQIVITKAIDVGVA